MPSLELLLVDVAADFPQLIECEWHSYESPMQSFFRLFCPIFDGNRDASMRESAERQLAWYQAEPESQWIKVVDRDNGDKIVGAALWKFYATNPFAHVPEEEAYWYPEGEAREYVTKALAQFDGPRHRMATRPHAFLNVIYTHPDYRRQGVADKLLRWGLDKADETGVESWLDATYLGRPVYERYGFTVVLENEVRPTKSAPGEAWTQLDQQLQPMQFWVMWRPPQGDVDRYKDGSVPRPWEVEKEQ